MDEAIPEHPGGPIAITDGQAESLAVEQVSIPLLNRVATELVGTAGLVLLVFSLAKADHLRFARIAVASYIGAAYWFISSGSFANPAVTIGRAFANTFAELAPGSLADFIGMQLVGGIVGLALVALIFDHSHRTAAPVGAK